LAKLHGTAFLLAENEIMQDMRLEIPDLTSLEVRVKDAKTGQTIPNPHTSLVDEEGFFIWGGSRTVALAAPTSTGKGARLVPERVERFDERVPGRYKLNVYDGTHLPYQTTIIVRQGQAAKLAVQLKRAQQVVFRLNEPAGDDLAPLARWQVGYRSVRSRDAKPFLEDGLGSYSGAVSSLWGGDPPRQLAIPVPPGEYDVEMMLAKHEDRSPQDKDIVWTGKAKVKVTKDKDGMIDIPLPKTSP